MKTLAIKGCSVLVDDEDVDKILQHTWYLNNTAVKNNGMHYFYTVKRMRGEKQYMYLHRYLLGCTPNDGYDVDHIDHDGLNLCKSNLRKCAHRDNSKNQELRRDSSSGYKGVHWSKCANKWAARITSDNVEYYLGLFNEAENAAEAYDKACLYFHKDFSILNFPKEEYNGCDIEKDVSEMLEKNNHSEYQGVSVNNNSWAAYISKDKKRYHLGMYDTEDEAARAYDIAIDILCKGSRMKNIPDAIYSEGEIKKVQEHIDGTYEIQKKRKSIYFEIYQQKNGKWTAYVKTDSGKIAAGTYPTELEAALARDRKAYQLLGDKARLNFPNRIAEYKKEA